MLVFFFNLLVPDTELGRFNRQRHSQMFGIRFFELFWIVFRYFVIFFRS